MRPGRRVFFAVLGVALLVAAFALARCDRSPARPPARPATGAQPAPAGFAASSPSAPVPGSPSPSRSVVPSSSVSSRPPAGSPVTSRKGVSAWSFDGVGTALRQSGASWYYTWSTNHNGITAPHGVEFVPMIWGSASVTTSALSQAKSAGCELLGFNEPDLAAQANMTVDQALDLWPKLQATGLELGSPAVAYGAADPGKWLDRFMTGVKARGLRVDFITLHWYGADFRAGPATAQLKSYLQAVYQRYHKPIWLTEYALMSFNSGGASVPGQAQQAAFVTESTAMMDGLSYLKRYAWFALPADPSKPSTGLYLPGPKATQVGLAYQAAR